MKTLTVVGGLLVLTGLGSLPTWVVSRPAIAVVSPLVRTPRPTCRETINSSADQESDGVTENDAKLRLIRVRGWHEGVDPNGGWVGVVANTSNKAARSYRLDPYRSGCLWFTKAVQIGEDKYTGKFVYDNEDTAVTYGNSLLCTDTKDHGGNVEPRRAKLEQQCNNKGDSLLITFTAGDSVYSTSVIRPEGGWTEAKVAAALVLAVPDRKRASVQAEIEQISARAAAKGDWYPCGSNKCCRVFNQ